MGYNDTGPTSGDTGVQIPASLVGVTGVGGTWSSTSARTAMHLDEQLWDYPSDNNGSAGGRSIDFGRPTWRPGLRPGRARAPVTRGGARRRRRRRPGHRRPDRGGRVGPDRRWYQPGHTDVGRDHRPDRSVPGRQPPATGRVLQPDPVLPGPLPSNPSAVPRHHGRVQPHVPGDPRLRHGHRPRQPGRLEPGSGHRRSQPRDRLRRDRAGPAAGTLRTATSAAVAARRPRSRSTRAGDGPRPTGWVPSPPTPPSRPSPPTCSRPCSPTCPGTATGTSPPPSAVATVALAVVGGLGLVGPGLAATAFPRPVGLRRLPLRGRGLCGRRLAGRGLAVVVFSLGGGTRLGSFQRRPDLAVVRARRRARAGGVPGPILRWGVGASASSGGADGRGRHPPWSSPNR